MPIVKVTLDTLARVIGPGDENSARDMGLLVRSMDKIRGETGGAHTMTVHHSGKNATKGARGSSALRAATDTELEVEGGRIIMRKQRNGEIVKPIGFRLVPVELGKDEDGGSVTSCTIELGASVDFEPQLTYEEQGWVDQLEEYTTMMSLDRFTTEDMFRAWKDNYKVVNAAKEGVAASMPMRTVRDHAARLAECGKIKLVSKEGAKTKLYEHAADAATTRQDDSD
jgi:hypothetical protein